MLSEVATRSSSYPFKQRFIETIWHRSAIADAKTTDMMNRMNAVEQNLPISVMINFNVLAWENKEKEMQNKLQKMDFKKL